MYFRLPKAYICTARYIADMSHIPLYIYMYVHDLYKSIPGTERIASYRDSSAHLVDSMQASERLSTRVSSIQNGISFISYSNRNHCLLRKYDKQFADVERLCSVIRYTKLQQFLRSIKRLPTYEYVIVLLDELEYSILKNIIARLEQYRQIRAILIIKSSNMINAEEEDKFKLHVGVNEETNKIIEIFGEYQSMFVRLEQLLHAAKERFDIHNIFITLNCNQKALRDLRQELGPFLWTHTFRRK